jgi:hypothetical protein
MLSKVLLFFWILFTVLNRHRIMTGTKLSKTFTIKETFQITWTNLSKHSKKKKKNETTVIYRENRFFSNNKFK